MTSTNGLCWWNMIIWTHSCPVWVKFFFNFHRGDPYDFSKKKYFWDFRANVRKIIRVPPMKIEKWFLMLKTNNSFTYPTRVRSHKNVIFLGWSVVCRQTYVICEHVRDRIVQYQTVWWGISQYPLNFYLNKIKQQSTDSPK